MVTIEPNARGGYSIRIAGAARAIGNYATRADAERIARLSGYVIKKNEGQEKPPKNKPTAGRRKPPRFKKEDNQNFKKNQQKKTTGDIENGK